MTDVPLHPLPTHPATLPWPTPVWPEGDLSAVVTDKRLRRFHALTELCSSSDGRAQIGDTHALVVINHGRLVFENYGPGKSASDTFPSWSMAKSITHALIGIAVRDGLININDRIPVPEWDDPADPRHALTWDQLLRMSSGLDWMEAYVPGQPSDVIEMLFGENALADTGSYAAKKPLVHAPGSHWYYSSGTTNILARALGDILGGGLGAIHDFMFEELFDKIGMSSPKPILDKVGTFVGSSFCYCTPRDFARFGYLYLRDGIWEGRRLLPEGWVDYARTPTPQPETEELGYGAHWWLNMCGPHSFSANGFLGQYTVIRPDLDLIIVRHGHSETDEQKDGVQAWLAELADCFKD